MYITRLELKGYQRLLLNNIDLFIYTPQSPFQLILGTNGSGKSSILQELSPLPAHKSKFAKNGYKIIHIEHLGHRHVLTSDFRNGKHSWILDDGENLNPGGTAEVQSQLALQYFQYTKDLHQILIGNRLFTRMSPADRRKWISAMSGQDYSYALDRHRKLASAARDQQGALKHLSARLAQEHGNLALLGDLDGLEERGHQLREELNLLLTARSPEQHDRRSLEQQLVSLQQQLSDKAKALIRDTARFEQLRIGYPSIAAVEQSLRQTEDAAIATQAAVGQMTNEYVELETAIHQYTTADGITPDTIDGYLDSLEQQLQQTHGPEPIFGLIDQPVMAEELSATVIPHLISLFGTLPDNTDRRFSRTSIDLKRDALREARNDVDRLDREIGKVRHRLEHVQMAKDTTCVACGHVWKEGVSPTEPAQLEHALEQLRAQRDGRLTEVAGLESFLNEADTVSSQYRQFVGYTSNYPLLRPLWDYIAAHRLHLEKPYEHVSIFHRWLACVSHAAETARLEKRIADLVELKRQWDQTGGMGQLSQRMTRLMAEVEAGTQKLHLLRAQQTSLQNCYSLATEQLRRVETLTGLQREINTVYQKWVESVRSGYIDQVTHQSQSELAGIQQRITEQRTLKGVVADLERDRITVQEAKDDLSLLADELSPIEGLIAEQLMGFIECLVGQLNAIIEAVWTYPMRILPCDNSGGELKYTFPVETPFSSKPNADVAETSKGQEQIINIAFVRTMMMYMGLKDFPLILDEPGEGFDEAHRNQLMGFIKTLMDTGEHPQLFMVSHYASNHGMFTQADVTVLDSSNIAVAGAYNQHVVLG